MIYLTHPRCDNGMSPNGTKPILGHTYWTLYTAMLRSLFRSNQLLSCSLNLFMLDSPPLNYEKIYEEHMGEFL